MAPKIAWVCSTCERKNPPHNLCCGQCGAGREEAPPDGAPEYATKEDVTRLESKLDAALAGKPAPAPAPPKGKGKKERDEILEDLYEDELEEEEGEGGAEE